MMNYFETNGITEQEKTEVMLFTSETACNGEKINYALRHNMKLTDEQKRRFDIVQRVISKSHNTRELTAYRVLFKKDIPHIELKKGKNFYDNGIMEVSLTDEIQDTFKDRDVVFIVRIPCNSKCLYDTPYNHRDYEQGVLFPAGSNLLITKVRRQGLFSTKTIVFCELCQ